MITWFERLHDCLRVSHVMVGSGGLLLFWLVISMKKGTSRHRLAGRCFAYSAFYVGGSAILSSVWGLLHFESYAPWIIELPESVQAIKRGQYQFLLAILLFLASATIAGAVHGLHAARVKENVAELRRTSLPYWQLAASGSGLGLAIFGGYHLLAGATDGGMPLSAYWVPLVLGAWGFSETAKEMRCIYRPMKEPREWLYRHIEQMFGTGIAFHTAFLVFGARLWLTPYLEGPMLLLPWFVPVFVGVAATKWYIARLKRLDFDDRIQAAKT